MAGRSAPMANSIQNQRAQDSTTPPLTPLACDVVPSASHDERPPTQLTLSGNSDRSCSRPPSQAYYRNVMNNICSVLYGDSSLNYEDSRACVEKWYEGDAIYENALTSALGKEAIADQFALMRTLPVHFSDEVSNVFESPSFDGGHSLIVDHIIHLYLIPSLAEESNQWSLIPPSPELTTPYLPNFMINNHPFGGEDYEERLHNQSSSSSSEPPRTLLRYILSFLTPRAFLYTFTHFKLRIVTRLEFNELGYITTHEDIWGIREFVEGFVPILGMAIYPVQRLGFGMVTSFMSRVIGVDKRANDRRQIREEQRNKDQQRLKQAQQQSRESRFMTFHL